jgi:hypothetical protein
MQNKANFRSTKMNITLGIASIYMIFSRWQGPKNKANSNPIKPKTNPIKANTNPIQTQTNPIPESGQNGERRAQGCKYLFCKRLD